MTPDYDRVHNLGIFDITVNGVLVHSRKCSSRTYGVPGHLWLRDESARQNAVWHAINSASANSLGYSMQKRSPSVSISSSTSNMEHAANAAKTIRHWFQGTSLHVEETLDDNCEWNFEIVVNGILLHSMKCLHHGVFHEDWQQQSLVWRAISDLSS